MAASRLRSKRSHLEMVRAPHILQKFCERAEGGKTERQKEGRNNNAPRTLNDRAGGCYTVTHRTKATGVTCYAQLIIGGGGRIIHHLDRMRLAMWDWGGGC